jgi:methanogenic corrinoid protein MtbC1
MNENIISSIDKPNTELKKYIDSLIKGEYNACLKYMKEYINTNSNIIQLYEEVLKKSLYVVGSMWEYNKITVATEHLATSITETLLNHIYENIYSSKKIGKKIILACTEKEEHRVGIRMVADIFENCGWETFFLGTNLPANELIKFIKDNQPDLIALSLSVYYNLFNLEKIVKMIRAYFPELPIIIGGQAFRHGGQDNLLKVNDVVFISDLYSLELFVKNKI